MASLKDTLAYLLLKYPHKQELSNARVTKMVYLGDWHHVLSSGSQMTDVKWFYDNYGPFVWDVKDTAEREKSLFRVASSSNFYGSSKCEFEILDTNYRPALSDSERRSLDHVIESTKQLGWDAFIRIVYSTYPIVSSQRYSFLDLRQKAAEYRQMDRNPPVPA